MKRRKAYWTGREERVLILQARILKRSPRQILALGFFPNRTIDSVAQKIRRMCLAHPERSQRCRLAKRFSPQELRKFHAYLRKHGRKLATWQIAQEFGVSRTTVKNHLRRLGIIVTWHEAMNLPAARIKRREMIERIRRLNINRALARRPKWERSLLRSAARIRAHQSETPFHPCNRCGRVWPATKKFFFTGRKYRVSKRRKVSVLRYRCRLCRTPVPQYLLVS